VGKPWTPKRKTVELRPSRIRRDPGPADKPLSLVAKVDWNSREWEIRLALIGIVLFAIALSAAVIDVGEVLSH
jgi:hypothetical protein